MNTQVPGAREQVTGKRPWRFGFRSSLTPGTRNLKPNSRGFTLVEMIVSVGLFAVVMVVSVSTLLALVNANRKAQALQSVMNNLNIALDGMVRSIRMGNNYYCGQNTYAAGDGAASCPLGDTRFVFEPYGNSATDQPTAYSFDSAAGQIKRSINGQASVAITASEVTITDMKFYLVGTGHGSLESPPIQPKVVIEIQGSAGLAGTASRTTFHIQATAVQRVLDL